MRASYGRARSIAGATVAALLTVLGSGCSAPPPSSDGGRDDGGQNDGGLRDGGQRDGGQRDGGQRDGGQRDGGAADGPGHVVYRSGDDGHLYRVEASPGAAPEDLSAALDALSPGADEWVNVSPNGRWLLISTERFGCTGWACAVRVSADLSEGEVVRLPSGEPIHPAFSAISDDGGLVVYPEDGGDGLELFATRRGPTGWAAPLLLTGASAHPYNDLPALSPDGLRALFACGATPYAQARTGICEVSVDGGGFREVLGPEDGPGGTADSSLRSADYAPFGGIVFESDWAAEQIWRLTDGASASVIAAELSNDNSPCALPGAVASLWLDRAGGEGYHELKIMDPDGGAWFMLVSGVDIMDIGMGCSR